MSAKIRETAPWMSPAGITFPRDDGTIFREHEKPPPTPDRIKPYRKSHYAQLGKTGLHHGIARDPPPPNEKPFGKPNAYNCSVGQCITSATAHGMAAVANEGAERIYASRKKEPLGHGAVAIQEPPEFTKRSTFAFGKPGVKGESVANVMYAASVMEPPKSKPVATAVNRNYDWASVDIDPSQHRFGGCGSGAASEEHKTGGELATSAKAVVDPGVAPTKLVPIAVANAHAVSGQVLGKVKNLGFGTRQRKAESTYGKPGIPDAYPVRALLSGCGDKVETEDDTLGRPVCRSAILRRIKAAQKAAGTDAADANRVFGVPTIRTDLAIPKHRKVTNQNNYGDGATASSLLTGVDIDIPARSGSAL